MYQYQTNQEVSEHGKKYISHTLIPFEAGLFARYHEVGHELNLNEGSLGLEVDDL